MPQSLYRSEQLTDFLARLGERYGGDGKIYMLGGSALLVLGSRRETVGVDYTVSGDDCDSLRAAIQTLAAEDGLDQREVDLSLLVPLAAGAESRHQLIGSFGGIQAYVFDLYSLAVMKVDRASPADFDDIKFLLKAGYLDLPNLGRVIKDVARRYDEGDALRRRFTELTESLQR